MTGTRRWFLQTVTAGGTAWLAGCYCNPGSDPTSARSATEPTRGQRIDGTLSAAARFLIGRQSPDGAWRSDVYGPFKDGPSLTPFVLRTLQALPGGEGLEASLQKGAAYLAALIQPDGTVNADPMGVTYPVYTSAGAVEVLSRPGYERYRQARDAWLAYLRARQLTEDLGWEPEDKPYGGWGYSPRLPRKPKLGEPLPPLTESNLSATVFALEALRAAEVSADDPAFGKALTFVQRCQNYPEDPGERDAAFDDGGFFFIYDDPVRNKAGVAGKDRTGQERYRSYGSTTADGLRALLLCGMPCDSGPGAAARAWLETHFRTDIHPGNYAADREHNRGAVYYYYCCAAAQARLAVQQQEPPTPGGEIGWAEALASELLRRQGADGSWVNPLVPQREDDPLVATSLAALSLACCRKALQM